MKVLAVAIITFTKLLEEVTRWHLGHVILVKILASIALLTQVTQPMLADCALTTARVSEWTMSPTHTQSNYIQLT